MERETGFEPATPSLEGWRSSQLSYSRLYLADSGLRISSSKIHNPLSAIHTWWGGEDSNLRSLKYQAGVVIAGDRRATEGFQIAGRRLDKVFTIDDHSAMAIAGAAGPCIEMAKLFQTELEHYEKLEGVQLSCEGKANKLGQMVKANLPMVFQGLVVMPLYVGYDLKRTEGRIFKYDLAGGRYEESDYHAIGSGGKDARNTMREHFRKGMAEQDALKLALLALYNAADDDVGTGGPDLVRGIYPTAKIVNATGITDVSEHQIRDVYDGVLATRRSKES